MKKENVQGSRLKPKCGCCHDLAWHPLHCSFNACHTDDLKIKSHVYSSLRSHGLMSNYRPPTKLREGNVLAISVILLRRGRGESSHVTITHAILKLTSFNRSLDLAIRCHERGGGMPRVLSGALSGMLSCIGPHRTPIPSQLNGQLYVLHHKIEWGFAQISTDQYSVYVRIFKFHLSKLL